jgi:hypothetical protein
MDITHINKVKEWIEIDNQAMQVKNTLSTLNDQKKELEEELLSYIEDNKLENITVGLSDGKLKFPKVSVKQTLSIKYIKTALSKYNEEKSKSNEIDIEELCKYLTDNLETTSRISIKRSVK